MNDVRYTINQIWNAVLAIMFFLIPGIIVAIIWYLLGPSGFWQILAMIIVSIVLYFLMLIAEMLVISYLDWY